MLQQTNIDTLFLFVSDMFARKRFKHMRNKKCNRLAFHSYPAAEELEHRELLAVAWIGQGPSPIEYGQVEGLTSQNNPVAGAIQAVVTHPTNPDVMWVGSVNGGVWGTTNATGLVVGSYVDPQNPSQLKLMISNIVGSFSVAGSSAYSLVISETGEYYENLAGVTDPIIIDINTSEAEEYTGKLIYLENIRPVVRSNDQDEQIKLIIGF